MAKVITTELQHSGASGANITLDSSKNVTCENNLQVDGNVTVTGTLPAAKLTGALPAISGASLTGISTQDTLSYRNRIINGAMEVNQRNKTTSVTGGVDAYYLDRFKATCGGGGGFSVTQETDAPAGLVKSLKVAVTSADSDIQASDWARVYTKLEGYTTADFGWGAAGAKTVTLSFWVKSSLTGNFALAIGNDGQSGYQSYQTQYAISAANTWEKKTITIAGPTSGNFAKDHNKGIAIFWGLKGGSQYNATQNQWNTTDTWFPSGSTQVVATNGATWFITGVQLELGSTATDFEYKGYPNELAACQRYFQVWRDVVGLIMRVHSSTQCVTHMRLHSPMRNDAPTYAIGDSDQNFDLLYAGGLLGSQNSSGWAFTAGGPRFGGFELMMTRGSGTFSTLDTVIHANIQFEYPSNSLAGIHHYFASAESEL
jgi:hypothetical protein